MMEDQLMWKTYSVDNHCCENRGGNRGAILRVFCRSGICVIVALVGTISN